MSSNGIKIYMDGLYTSRSFERDQVCENQSLNDKVMASGSWECKTGSLVQRTNGRLICRGPIIRTFTDKPIFR